MKKPKIRDSYRRRCANYVLWLAGPLYEIDQTLSDNAEGEFDAVEAMFLCETHGAGRELSCSEPRMFDALYKGKQSREFHIKAWLSMTRAGEAQPEEFFGCLGLRSAEEFHGVFGRPLSLRLLRSIHLDLERQIAVYEDILKSSENSGILLAVT